MHLQCTFVVPPKWYTVALCCTSAEFNQHSNPTLIYWLQTLHNWSTFFLECIISTWLSFTYASCLNEVVRIVVTYKRPWRVTCFTCTIECFPARSMQFEVLPDLLYLLSNWWGISLFCRTPFHWYPVVLLQPPQVIHWRICIQGMWYPLPVSWHLFHGIICFFTVVDVECHGACMSLHAIGW